MILCIDIGGTSVKTALMDKDGQICKRATYSTCIDGYHTPLMECVMTGINEFLRNKEIVLNGIGVSATGQIDTRMGKVIGTGGNILNYEGENIKERLENQYKVPVHVLNDANAAALGEWFAGSAKGKRCVIMITLGTGVGGGIVIDGKIFGGVRGIAGEIGHTTLFADGAPCACGKHGCLENYASTNALVKMARAKTGDQTLDGITIFERAGMGDKAMLLLIDHWMNWIAEGASSLIHIINPDILVIGGGVSTQKKLLLNPLKEKILGHTMREFAVGLEITGAILGNDAGLFGAYKNWIDMESGFCK